MKQHLFKTIVATKQSVILLLLCLLSSGLLGQTQGIGYQAILIDQNAKEIPGVDVQGNYLPSQPLTMRFSIYAEGGTLNYQEEHQTSTDVYGMINLTIGWGEPTAISPGEFADIDWDGYPKSLNIEISLGEASDSFEEFSSEELKFVPYAYHRNITATGTMIIEDVTDLNSDLNVNNGSPSNLSGDLTVGQVTNLEGDLNVNNASNTHLTGNLDTDGETNLNSTLSVNNASATLLSGDLTVQGQSNMEEVNLTTLNSTSSSDEFIANFENTNGNGSGIKIKLGKQATKNNALATNADAAIEVWLGEISVTEFEFITGILDGDLTDNMDQLLVLANPVDPAEIAAMAATVCSMTEAIGSKLTGFLNSTLGLPITIGPWGYAGVNIVPEMTVFPSLPPVNLPCDFLGDGFNLPNLSFSDVYVDNPLNSDNKFIEFTDNDDFTMGAIQAQSIENWAMQYLDIVFLHEVYSTFKGMDKAEIMPELNVLGKEIAASYLEIGVSYSSGNGDYAEWLERLNPDEHIGTGDIVAVKGGKITKDLSQAEQVMAVSYRPIVLGNTPQKGKEHLGSNVAFMGQIPVKVMGPVRSGDYIVGKGNIPGYGIAISPQHMTLSDFNCAVGRSWGENLSDGPKMVNTVVGVHNGDYLNILKKYEQRFSDNEQRLKKLEKKMNLLINNNQVSKQ